MEDMRDLGDAESTATIAFLATTAILSLCVFSFFCGLFVGASKPPKKPCGYVWSLNGDPAMFHSYPINDEWKPVYFEEAK